jgi:hypothetical protein
MQYLSALQNLNSVAQGAVSPASTSGMLTWALNAKPTLAFDAAAFSDTVMTSFDLGNLGAGNVSFDVSYQGIYETERQKYFSNLLVAITWEL